MSSYFISEVEELIFYLVELDGRQQLEKLKVNRMHYNFKSHAVKWRDSIYNTIFDSRHPNTTKALERLEELYQSMIHE